MGSLESRFLRAIVEMLQQETRGGALARLRQGLAPHWLRTLSRDVLGAREPDATVGLDTGIELLLAMESVLSGGSGAEMVRANAALASRVLSRSAGLVVPGDLVRTLQHLHAPFEQPFVGVPVCFCARGTPDGFALELELTGQMNAARWLSWAGVGYARAAATFSGHAAKHFRFDVRLAADGARITARRTTTGLVELSASQRNHLPRPALPAASSSDAWRAAPVRRRTPLTNAVARVDQILNRSALTSTLRGSTAAPEPASRAHPCGERPALGERSPADSGVRAAVSDRSRADRKSAR